jgi:hypothetical protein
MLGLDLLYLSFAEGAPEGVPAAFAPAIGAGLAESRRRLGSSLGRAPAVILEGIAAGTFPETMFHSPRGFFCYSGQLLYCNGACEELYHHGLMPQI